MSEIAVAITTEIEPPAEGKKSRRPRKRNANRPLKKKNGVHRPYRSLPADVLSIRVAKLTTRLEKVKKQHETTRLLLTKYAHESFYRDKEALESAQEQPQPPELPTLPDGLDMPPTGN